MIYQVRLFKGLQQPRLHFQQLGDAESVYGLRKRVLFLFLSSILILALSSWFGLGTHEISAEINTLSNSQFEWEKFLFFLGRILNGALFAAIILYLMALWFHVWLDAPFHKLIAMQALAFIPLLIEQAVHILLVVWLGISTYSSPFSLGPIVQSLHAPSWIAAFFGCISLFKLWTIYLQYIGIRRLTGGSQGYDDRNGLVHSSYFLGGHRYIGLLRIETIFLKGR